MELDELKDRAQKADIPDRRFHAILSNSNAVTDIVNALKAEDQRERRRARTMMLSSVAAGVLYVLLFALTWIAPPDDSPVLHRFVLSSFGFLFLSAALVSRMRSNHLAGIDYAQPIGSFLTSVERRYRPFSMRDAAFGGVYVAAFSVTGALGWLGAKDRYFPSMDQGTALMLYGVILAAALVVGLILGVNEWKKRKAPLLRQVTEMNADLNALESETANE